MPTHDPHSVPSGATTPHAFTPQAVMARVRAHAERRAAEAAARPGKFNTVLDLAQGDPLAAIAAELDRAQPEPPRPAPGAPSADDLLDSIARIIDGGHA